MLLVLEFQLTLLGTAKNSLEELIIQRRNVVISQNPANGLVIDAISAQLIREQGVTLTSIIPLGQVIRLKNIANMAQGAHVIDVTDEIDPIIYSWVNALVVELGSGHFALDLMSSDHKKYVEGNTFALEINARAEWMHHTFSERRTHNLASVVLDELGLF